MTPVFDTLQRNVQHRGETDQRQTWKKGINKGQTVTSLNSERQDEGHTDQEVIRSFS